MNRNQLIWIMILGSAILGMSLIWARPVQADRPAQLPTVSIATVTSTPIGTIATVNLDQDPNLRSGPGTDYPKVGLLLGGQTVPALGRSAQGLWILVAYSGVEGGTAWVYAPLVSLSGNDLPIVEPPPTPTPRTTPTIDPTLAAQFLVDTPVPRPATFTPPPPVVIPTLPDVNPSTSSGGIPMILVIALLALLGFVMGIISLMRRH